MKYTFLSLIILVAAIGCKHEEEDTVVEEAIKPPVFEGTIDKTLVGKWATTDKSQQLAIAEDGTVKMHGKIHTPKGPQEINEDMEWKTKDKKLVFKMSDGKMQQYGYTISGEELQLKTAKTTTTYKKDK